ncbi:hypothetical protein ACFLYY_00795 [Patescibacteria group bacterium]
MAKKAKFIVFLGVVFIFSVFLGLTGAYAQTVDITVSATVQGTSTCGDLTCEGIESCQNCPGDCGICEGGGDDYYVSPNTKAVFQGKAYPFANITIQKNGAVAATFKADGFGFFEKEIGGLPAGTYNFLIFAEDNKGIISAGISFTTPIIENKTTLISRIFIPPTINASPTQIERGQIIDISGQTFPAGELNLLILPKNIIHIITPSLFGDWFYELNTFDFEEGSYTLQANSTDSEGEQSAYSDPITFFVLKSRCQGADLNFDGGVDLVDFSILLYFWQQTNPTNYCADINSDGIVSIIDFSIMMYYWSE